MNGTEFYAKSFLNGPIELTTRQEFYNRVPARYVEMLTNYYDNPSPKRYEHPLTKEVLIKLQPMVADGGYVLPWSTLTHVELSDNNRMEKP